MFSAVVLIIFLTSPFYSLSKVPTKINTTAVVDYINRLKNGTWKADTYGLKEINTREFAKQRLGLKIRKRRKTFSRAGKLLETEADDLPESFTWVPANLKNTDVIVVDTFDCPIDQIYDQSNCGSCWAVATAAVFSDRVCLHSGGAFKTPLSANHITACDNSNYGCGGGYMTYLMKYLENNGTVTGGDYDSEEGCQPYSIRPCGGFTKLPCSSKLHFTPKCKENKCSNRYYKYKKEKNNFTINKAEQIWGYWDDYSARKEIYKNGPMVATFYVYEDFLLYKKGIYEHKKGHFVGGHAVKVVGWGIESDIKYWHVANSWGTDWGEDGFFRISRGKYNNGYFGVEMYALEPNMTNITND